MKTVREVVTYLTQFQEDVVVAVPIIWTKQDYEEIYNRVITLPEWRKICDMYLDAEQVYESSIDLMDSIDNDLF